MVPCEVLPSVELEYVGPEVKVRVLLKRSVSVSVRVSPVRITFPLFSAVMV